MVQPLGTTADPAASGGGTSTASAAFDPALLGRGRVKTWLGDMGQKSTLGHHMHHHAYHREQFGQRKKLSPETLAKIAILHPPHPVVVPATYTTVAENYFERKEERVFSHEYFHEKEMAHNAEKKKQQAEAEAEDDPEAYFGGLLKDETDADLKTAEAAVLPGATRDSAAGGEKYKVETGEQQSSHGHGPHHHKGHIKHTHEPEPEPEPLPVHPPCKLHHSVDSTSAEHHSLAGAARHHPASESVAHHSGAEHHNEHHNEHHKEHGHHKHSSEGP